MISKKDLITALKQSLYTEERAMPIYTKHLDSTIFFSGFDEKVKENIKSTLLTLKRESERHEQIFKSIIEKIESSLRDVY